MKVLFIVDQFPKLSETFVLNQITAFSDAGLDVGILCENPSSDSLVHPDVLKYDLLNKTTTYGYCYDKHRRYKESLRILLKVFFKSPGLAIKSLRFLRYGSAFKSLRHLFVMKELQYGERTIDVDLVISHFGPNGSLAAMMKDLGLLQGKVMTFFHGYDMTSYLKWHPHNAYDFLFRHGDVFLPISDFWRRRLLDMGCPGERVKVHHMGIDLRNFTFASAAQNQRYRLLTVARYVEKKGIEYAIRALALLKDKGFLFEYRIFGGGTLIDSHRELIKQLDLSDEIKIFSETTQDVVLEELLHCDLFILPSVTSSDGDMEGIPVSLMEAMAIGRIVISTRHSGIPELIADSVNGFLVEERNSETLADAIIRAVGLSGPELEAMKLKARSTIEHYFNQERLNEELIEMGRALVTGRLR